ncbi:hypothetical protein A7985_04145 [Pseudoalteromonas luteoviolacea]|uniref:Uncharacterized protein n=1 Tax=Pseudoalteromonas luteoviolacea TaxID=43657 RepID=A0A1C0TV03_9GAMM|nr:hypothetical protein [Pseudoalteromonas luteoviolacea]OCQ23149.1 hypothetical protein A7985_04145 [Pseudoalteromonas luteoviolacea]
MDIVIEEERWSFVCFERGEEIFLTYLVQTGPAMVDYTVKLNTNEIASIKSGMYKAKSLLGSFDSSRFVKPAIWPQK